MPRIAAMTARWVLLRRQVNASFIILAWLSTVLSVSATNCYTPDGTISNDRPCNASASASVCCTQGFLCTSNQLCQPAGWWDGSSGNPLQFIRGTCTDKTWAAPECQGQCVADNPSGGEWVMRCGNTTNNYCCSADDCCTKASYLKFTLDEPTITATAGISPASTATTTTESSTQSSTVTRSTGTSTSTVTTSTGTSTTSSVARAPTTSAAPTTSPASNSNNLHSSSSGSSTTIAIGVGVGVGAGVVIVGCLLALFLVRLRRKKRLAAEQKNNPTFLPGSQKGPFGVYPPVILAQQYPSELDSQQQQQPIVAELDGVHTGKHEVR